MNSRTLYTAAMITLAFVLLLLRPVPARACTFEVDYPSLEEWLPGSNLVRGRVVETDTARQNYIIQIESYLRGNAGPEFVVLSGTKPAIIQGLIDSNLGNGDCIFWERPLPENEVGYFDLGNPSAIGVYEIDLFRHFIWESWFPLKLYDDNGITVKAIYSQPQFEQYILDLYGTKPAKPLPGSRYPATAPLLVTTNDGKKFVLPVTGEKLVPFNKDLRLLYIPEQIGTTYKSTHCVSWDCVTWSADGRTLIVQLAKNSFVYVQSWYTFPFEADNFLLSPSGLAAWLDNTLTIYALHSVVSYSSEVPQKIAQVDLQPNDVANADNSIWSPDGRLLAFSDTEGLWLWDVFTPESTPILLIPTDSITPVAVEFSGLGRYLAVVHGNERFTLDLLSRTHLPFGSISPDEKLMVVCEPLTTADSASQNICQLQLESLVPRGERSSWETRMEGKLKITWVNDRRVLIQGCDADKKECGVMDADAYEYDFDAEWGDFYSMSMYPFLSPAIDFAVQGRNVAILIDETTINVNGAVINLDLDSPIKNIRWLPSVFYGESPYQPQIQN